jgi:hypothetical protein
LGKLVSYVDWKRQCRERFRFSALQNSGHRRPLGIHSAPILRSATRRSPIAALSAVRRAINENLPGGYEEGMQFGMIGWYSLRLCVRQLGLTCDGKISRDEHETETKA